MPGTSRPKELHELRFTFYRGTEKVQRANLVAAITQNMKKLANLLAEKDRLHSISSISCRAEHLELVEYKKKTNQIVRSDLVRQQTEELFGAPEL